MRILAFRTTKGRKEEKILPGRRRNKGQSRSYKAIKVKLSLVRRKQVQAMYWEPVTIIHGPEDS